MIATFRRPVRENILIKDLDPWISDIRAANLKFRKEIGATKMALLTMAGHALSAPRAFRRAVSNHDSPRSSVNMQYPWLPRWPALSAVPIHDRRSHDWTDLVCKAYQDIRRELFLVQESFTRARYDSDANPTQWGTYYFYLHGRPIDAHLAACPRTAEVLSKVPHNGLHVCFSAIQPGGSLHPHTGPTNASLTAHLGLANCAGATLWVGGQAVDYREGDVLAFDDSFVHWVQNSGSAIRYTLMITFWHPELSTLERHFLRQVMRIRGSAPGP